MTSVETISKSDLATSRLEDTRYVWKDTTYTLVNFWAFLASLATKVPALISYFEDTSDPAKNQKIGESIHERNEGAPYFNSAEPSKVFLSRVGKTSSLNELLATDERLEEVECVLNVNKPYPDFDLQKFEKMKNLRALCSTDQHIEIQSLDFLKRLKVAKNLTVLSLRGVSQVVRLPDALCRNANPRVLELNSCHNLEMLPEEIGTLLNLTHLDITKCYLLERMPKGLASLTKLRVLKGFLVVEDEVSCSFASLTGLKKLNKLSIYLYKIDFASENEQSVLHNFLLLRDFAVHWGGRAGTRKPHQPSKVDETDPVLEEVITDGLEGRGSCSPFAF